MIPIAINRNASLGKYAVTEIFRALDKAPGLRRLLPDKRDREKLLSGTHVEVVDEDTYMWTDDEDGHVNVGLKYLLDGEEEYLYLDILHELVHVRQFKDGKELFDTKYDYIDRPTEVEAYQFVVNEARHLGLSEARIFDYLEVDWITKRQHKNLARRLGVKT